jgi:hypothetical protein
VTVDDIQNLFLRIANVPDDDQVVESSANQHIVGRRVPFDMQDLTFVTNKLNFMLA